MVICGRPLPAGGIFEAMVDAMLHQPGVWWRVEPDWICQQPAGRIWVGILLDVDGAVLAPNGEPQRTSGPSRQSAQQQPWRQLASECQRWCQGRRPSPRVQA